MSESAPIHTRRHCSRGDAYAVEILGHEVWFRRDSDGWTARARLSAGMQCEDPRMVTASDFDEILARARRPMTRSE